MGQLANELKNQQKGKFPSDIEQNPRDQCKAITLKSGKKVESSRQREEKGKEDEVEGDVEEPEKAKAETTRCSKIPLHCSKAPKPRGISFPNNPPIISPLLPFPQRF